MTMLAHTIKSILTLVPEAMPLVKLASIDKEFPLDNADSCIASALQLKYFEKVAYSPVDFTTLEKVATAVKLWGVGETVADLSKKMIKAAAATKDDPQNNYFLKEASFQGEIPTLAVSKRSEGARALYKAATENGLPFSDAVELYSGHAHFDKEAALKSLTVRYNATQNVDFVKIARVIVESEKDERLQDADNLVKIANFVTSIDEKEGLQFKGFNFFQEAFIKEAAFKSALLVKLAGKSVPYESIERVGKTCIASYMGADVAREMDSGPENFKQVAETLPLDMQRLLLNLTKNV